MFNPNFKKKVILHAIRHKVRVILYAFITYTKHKFKVYVVCTYVLFELNILI